MLMSKTTPGYISFDANIKLGWKLTFCVKCTVQSIDIKYPSHDFYSMDMDFE